MFALVLSLKNTQALIVIQNEKTDTEINNSENQYNFAFVLTSQCNIMHAMPYISIALTCVFFLFILSITHVAVFLSVT
jgi:hypothetical protein